MGLTSRGRQSPTVGERQPFMTDAEFLANIKQTKSSFSFELFYDELEEAVRPPLRYPAYPPVSYNLLVYTLPHYTVEHNYIVPLSVRRQLSAMSPREYLTYIFSELTVEERESLLIDERYRRKTFLVNWPHNMNHGSLTGILMAQSGFFALGTADWVECVFCRGRLHDWADTDNVMAEHSGAFSFCGFMKGFECGNRVYEAPSTLTAGDMVNVTVYPRNSGESDGCEFLGISTDCPDSPRYAPASARLRTFARYPAEHPIPGQRLCDAGFFYTGFDDHVRCFYCSGGIKEWRLTDEPWVEHARWFPDCLFLNRVKGRRYVDEVHASTPAHKKCRRETVAQAMESSAQQRRLTEQNEMLQVCVGMGHSLEVIEQAIANNGRPFETIAEMIDAIDLIEHSGDIITLLHSQPTPVWIRRLQENHSLASTDQDEPLPGSMTQDELTLRFQLACKSCARRAPEFVGATHIGLPCGHLIFCNSCAANARTTADNPESSVYCPFPCCGSQLAGTMRVYFL